MKIKLTLLILALPFIFVNASFCQEKNEGILPKEVGNVFKNVLKDVDIEKAGERAKTEEELNAKLDSAVKDWISKQEAKRNSELNDVIEWGGKKLIGAPDVHNPYYLRDYSCTFQSKDIKESTEISYPYQASAIVKELLYVEEGPLIAEPRSKYQYVFETDFILEFKYNKNSLALEQVGVREGNYVLKKGWPQEVLNKVKTYFIPVR